MDFSKRQIDKRTEIRFHAARDRALGLIEDRMRKYEDALWAGVAAIESHGGDMSYAAWKVFAETLQIDKKYPGINGIGVIEFHSAQSVGEYLTEQWQDRPNFRIYPEHDQPIFMPITYIEPEGINAAAVGLDVAHELNRRTAALASRDTGTAQITGPITLVQDADRTSGFLFYAPYYNGAPPSTISGRQEQILGAVYAPFVVHKLMEGLLAKELRDVRFSIQDDSDLIYDEHEKDDPMFDPNPMFSETISIDIYGRTWVLDLRSDLGFREENSYSQPTFVLIAGLLIEALIISLLFLMSRANARAVTYADHVTHALRQESEKLALSNSELTHKNHELEQFAYIASHDLKTPIRGIGGLTEMIEEDLEDYFASPTANPDIRENLSLIQDRVERMSHLTRGIMELSQVVVDEDNTAPVYLEEVVEALTLDFGLEAGQLRRIGDVHAINTDPFNFRRVLENLVGNAIKYHDGVNSLEILIVTEVKGDRCCVSVRDNGPGIDPKYHERIFEVFQTLRTGDAPESTGIGLAIVKKAVEGNGGKILLTSSLGDGATFNFDWPNPAILDASDSLNEAA